MDAKKAADVLRTWAKDIREADEEGDWLRVEFDLLQYDLDLIASFIESPTDTEDTR